MTTRKPGTPKPVSTTKKQTEKQLATRKPSSKRVGATPKMYPAILRKEDAEKSVAKAGAFMPLPIEGYDQNEEGLLVPKQNLKPIAPNKIQAGLQKANRAISKMVEEFAKMMTEDYSIKEIEFSVSFDADGKFMGIGIGGSTAIKVRIAPTKG